MRAIAVTTIAAQDSIGVNRLIKLSEVCSAELVLIGDRKSPTWNKNRLPTNVHFFSVEDQIARWPQLSALIPLNHYARKNLAYLWAIENGVDVLLDTDDDNYADYDVFEFKVGSYRQYTGLSEWVNAYAHFGKPEIWPRGLPLSEALKPLESTSKVTSNITWHCFQSIVDGDPDLDAIGRMLNPQQHFFEDLEPLLLGSSNFCPTNSQATLWDRKLFPYLYLPITSSFRMTDIWRGIIVSGFQNLHGLQTVFGKLGFIQVRNEHNLISDFIDETPGHIHNLQIKKISDSLWSKTSEGLGDLETFVTIYKHLVDKRILRESELKCVSRFIQYARDFST